MHKLLIKALSLNQDDITIEHLGVGDIFKIKNHGILKKKPFKDVFLLKKFTHPMIDGIKKDTIASYLSFVYYFNIYFKDAYEHEVLLPPTYTELAEHFEINFINSNEYELFYTIQMKFKGEHNYSDNLFIRYKLVEGKPVTCTIDFNIGATSGFYRHSSKILDFEINMNYYLGQHIFILAFIYKRFLPIVEETFESFDDFVYNIDDNLKILIMQTF